MKKCRYSIDGKCTNENVACEECNSTDHEMKACLPFQRCIILLNDNWAIDVPDHCDKCTYGNEVMEAVRQRLGLEDDDVSEDSYIMSMDKKDVFRKYCEWNGLFGSWSEKLLNIVEDIYGIQIGD